MHSPHINHIRDLLKLAPPVISSNKKESFDQERRTSSALRIPSYNTPFDFVIKKDACTQTDDIKRTRFDRFASSIFACFNPQLQRKSSFSMYDCTVNPSKTSSPKAKSGSLNKRTPTWNELYHNISYSSDGNVRRSRTNSSMINLKHDGSITPPVCSSRLTSIMAYNAQQPSNHTSENQLNANSKTIVLTTIS